MRLRRWLRRKPAGSGIAPSIPGFLSRVPRRPAAVINSGAAPEIGETMSKEEKPELKPEPETPAEEAKNPNLTLDLEEQLDEEEREFRALRRDLPGVKGVSAVGIVSINVNRKPEENEYFRTNPDFGPVIPLVHIEVGMERQFFAVTDPMVISLASIGITVTNHRLYLIVSPSGAVRIIPINVTSDNEYTRTKEIGLIDGVQKWVRLYTDTVNKVYKVFPAPDGRFSDPIWPELKQAKIFRLAFRDKGRLIDSPEHPLFLKWAARDKK
jgi:hypothetical protein